ncbi:hypothetical protein P154DRAFT_103746 [Amniculicola lignicola CBS 123094]|uniref:Uncharacterized protein n=1 Tax=Amniculicola lignicola CBS 123094 TaxID=1392246 RepID=A0A6A5WW74_9PLEO|nr:hypothetical protein P154DRAFT_103746 [Amniculicola lignicola CBS 123094]
MFICTAEFTVLAENRGSSLLPKVKFRPKLPSRTHALPRRHRMWRDVSLNAHTHTQAYTAP